MTIRTKNGSARDCQSVSAARVVSGDAVEAVEPTEIKYYCIPHSFSRTFNRVIGIAWIWCRDEDGSATSP